MMLTNYKSSLILLGAFGGFWYFFDYFQVRLPLPTDTPFHYNELNSGYLVNTPGCRIPDLDPYDKSVKSFIFKPPPLKCHKQTNLFESNLTHIFFTKSEELFKKLQCCYKEFKRKNPKRSEFEHAVKYQTCQPIPNLTEHINNSEYIKIECQLKNKLIYQDYIAFPPISEFNLTFHNRYSVLIFGIDAISRINLHRQLPKTYDFLINRLNAIEMLGYNKVGDNTFPNLIPVLTGLYEEELKVQCWKDQHFDNCSFIWDDFKRNDYLTSYAEDCAWIGLFNYQKKGFLKQPTDAYYTTFSREAEKLGSDKDFNCFQCIGKRPVYLMILEYAKKFVEKFANISYFGFFWTNSLGHDYLNRPALGDEPYRNFLEDMHSKGVFNNTILIFLSDHGIRWGDIRATYQGQMEERLPFVIISVPDNFRKPYPKRMQNLMKNSRRLTTPFDLHATLKQLAGSHTPSVRGQSFFEAISTNRTCGSEGIDSHWCTCQNSHDINKTDSKVKLAANYAVDYINVELIGYAQCAKLKLDKILSARLQESESVQEGDKDYTISFSTLPSSAIFEVTVRIKDKSNDLVVTGTISRLNRYGDQSKCITNYHLKLYCYCTSLL